MCNKNDETCVFLPSYTMEIEDCDMPSRQVLNYFAHSFIWCPFRLINFEWVWTSVRLRYECRRKSGASNPGSVNLKFDWRHWISWRMYRISVSLFFLRIVCTHRMGHINDVCIIQKVPWYLYLTNKQLITWWKILTCFQAFSERLSGHIGNKCFRIVLPTWSLFLYVITTAFYTRQKSEYILQIL